MERKTKILLFLIFVFGFSAHGQYSKETQRIDSLYAVGKAYWVSNPQVSKELGHEIIARSEQLNYPKGEANGTYLLAMALWYLEDYSQSLGKITEARDKYEAVGDPLGIAGCYNSIGMIYHQIGADAEALDYFFKALKISQKTNFEPGEAKTLTNIGVVYREQGDNDQALEYFFRSVRFFEENPEHIMVGIQYANIAFTYQIKKEYDRAIKYFNLAYEDFKKDNNEVGLVKYYPKMGDLYTTMGLYEDAELNFQKGFDLAKRLELQEGLIENATGLIRSWDRLGKNESSDSLIAFLDPGVQKLQNPRSRLSWYSTLAKHYESNGNFSKSIYYLQEMDQLKDDILGSEQKRALSQWKAIHNLEKVEKENAILKENLEITKKTNLGVALALLIFLGLIIMISRFYNLKEKANKQLTSLNEELIAKQKEIEEKAEELSKANYTISNINSRLEKIIDERTAELKEKNKKILDFTFFNSHQVRGALARIMGLLGVMGEAKGKKESESVSDLLRAQADELDALLKDINDLLHEEGYADENFDQKSA